MHRGRHSGGPEKWRDHCKFSMVFEETITIECFLGGLTIAINGFTMVFWCCYHRFQWFSMVPDHWSNDAMVSMDRCGLTGYFLTWLKSEKNWMSLWIWEMRALLAGGSDLPRLLILSRSVGTLVARLGRREARRMQRETRGPDCAKTRKRSAPATLWDDQTLPQCCCIFKLHKVRFRSKRAPLPGFRSPNLVLARMCFQ